MSEFMAIIEESEAAADRLAPAEIQAIVEGHSAFEEKLRAASAYIDAQSLPTGPRDNPNWWAIEKAVPATGEASPDDLWQFILEVLARKPDDKVIEVLAAGPLEDLIARFGTSHIEVLEAEARTNPAFRGLLGGVWQNRTPAAIWSRIERARGASW